MIILVSLQLFNEVGESNLTAVDIANELDISPGNLYYHFKGKEEIIAELFKHFSSQLEQFMNLEPEGEDLLLENWLQLYVLLELIYRYRFFFRNVSDLEKKYPGTTRKLVKLIAKLRVAVRGGVVGLGARGGLAISSEQEVLVEGVSNNILLVLLYWDSFQVIQGQPETEKEFVQDASLQILFQISPLLNEEQFSRLKLCHQSYMDGDFSGDS